MDSSYEVPDPSDWLRTPVAKLGPVEHALRCQVCKDFFDTPMITSCSHTFCSLCIRRCITSDGRCPACRAQEQAIKLRPNYSVQELVDTFQKARPEILLLCKDAGASETNHATKKRKLGHNPDSDNTLETERRAKSRDQRRSTSNREAGDVNINIAVDDANFLSDDGLMACPICDERMREEAVFSHLDVHNGKDATPNGYRDSARPDSSRSQHPQKAMERLPQLNYSLLKDNALKKKMLELGISSAGSRALLVNRHIEWVNLVNANCDSTKPRSKRDLLRELDVWDRNQSRQASNSTGGGAGAGIMHKDFDGLAWASSHNTDFQALIAKARQKPHSNVEVNSSPASLLPNDLASSRPVDQPGSPPNDQDPDRNASLTKMSIEEAAAVRQGSFVDLDMEN